MLQDIKKLLVLQDRDTSTRDLNADIERIPLEQENSRSQLAGDEARLEKAKGVVTENEIAMKNLELDIDTRRDTIAKLEKQRFETKKNSEYTALGTEVERYQAEVIKLEDGQLELMEKGEELKAIADEAQAQLDKTTTRVEGEIAAFDDRLKSDQARIAEIEAERGGLTEGIDLDLLANYDRILSSKGDLAVVALKAGDICSGCNMKVIASAAADARGGVVIASCPNCGRILYAGE